MNVSTAKRLNGQQQLFRLHCTSRCLTKAFGTASVALLALLLLESCGGGESGANHVQAQIISPSGIQRLVVEAELAQNEEARRRGLKGREPLPPGHGLLIVLPQEGEVCITNDRVPFAIDAIFVAADGIVVAVETAIAAGDATLRCHGSVQQILEVTAGQAAGVLPGDRLVLQTLASRLATF